MSGPLFIDQGFIKRMTNLVLENLGDDKFGPQELAHLSGMSLYRLNRRLQLIDKKTCNQFIREIRLGKAMELLQNEAFTVSEVAYKSGFSSPSYFISCFHEYFGYPPGKVKKDVIEFPEVNFNDLVVSKLTKMVPLRSIFFNTVSGIMVLAVLANVLYFFLKGDVFSAEDSTIIHNEKSIAVLPFRNLSDDITDQYFYDGVMDEVFNNLTKINGLRVISNTSVEKYRNTKLTIPEIGAMLDVDYIIEGTGQKFGTTFRLRVQLIEVKYDMRIWSVSFQKKMKNTKRLFRIQNHIAQSIGAEFKATMTQME